MASGPDLTHAVQFDLAQGAVRLEGDPAVLAPAKAFSALLNAAPADLRARIGGELGGSMGARVETLLGGPKGVREASLEAVVSHLSAELALGGLGTLAIERWGRALVFHLTGAPFEAPDFYASLVAAAISRATGTAAYSTVLSSKDGVRVLIASQAAAQRVRGWLDQGIAWGDAVARLQGGAS